MTAEQDRYFLRTGKGSRWQEVSKEDYVSAERSAGFFNTLGRPYDPATAGFHSGNVSGRLCYGGKNLPEHFVPLWSEPGEEEPPKGGKQVKVMVEYFLPSEDDVIPDDGWKSLTVETNETGVAEILAVMDRVSGWGSD